MKKKKMLTWFLVVCLLLTGCARNAPAEDTKSAVVPFSCVANSWGKQKIYVILKTYHGSYWQEVINGVCEAAVKTDKAVYLGGVEKETDIEGQKALMEEALDGGADAILLAPVDSTYMVEDCIRARGKDVPVALVDSSINTSDFDVCFMTDNMEAGKMAAQEMLRMLYAKEYSKTEELQVTIQLSSDIAQAMVNRVSGFLDYWSKNAPGQWTIIEDIRLNGGNSEKARVNTLELMEKNPSIRAVFACNNTSTIGAAQAIREKNRTDVVLVGFDMAEETKAIIHHPGYSAVTILQHQKQMGYNGIMALDGFLRGEMLQQKYFDTGVTVIDRDYVLGMETS